MVWQSVVIVSITFCVAVGYLWWHGHRTFQDQIETTAFHTYTRVTSSGNGLDIILVRRWNWPYRTEVRFSSAYGREQIESFEFLSVGERPLAIVSGILDIRSGRSQTYMTQSGDPTDNFDDGNMPLRIGHGDSSVSDDLMQNGGNWSIALPVVTAHNVPYWLPLCAMILPLPVELFRRIRRAIKRWKYFTHRRRGLSLSSTAVGGTDGKNLSVLDANDFGNLSTAGR